MSAFCVYLTRYSGNKLPVWYIGSSNANKVKNEYNGSVRSKKYKEIYNLEQKENKHLFKTRIISYHETRQEALDEELRVQKIHSVKLNDNYFNEAYASVNGFFGRDVSGKLNPNYGNKWSEEQIEWASRAHTGVKRTTESKLKQSMTISGENHWNYGNTCYLSGKTYEEVFGAGRAVEIKKKLSEALTGRIVKESSVEKMKNSDYHSADTYEKRFGKEKAEEIRKKVGHPGHLNGRAALWKLISPSGKIIEVNGNLNSTIKENKLSVTTVKSNINKGKIKMRNENNIHNGWELIKIDEENHS